jgi:hypothetical protein
MDQPHLAEPCSMCGAHVFVDDGRNVARRERMEIEAIVDRDPISSHF